MVRWELSDRSLGALFSLLVSDDDELSYQAMAAARALGLTVWAAGTSNDSWDITMPTGAQFRLARPEAVSPLRGRPSG